MLNRLTSIFSEILTEQLEDKLLKTLGFGYNKTEVVVKVIIEDVFKSFKDELLRGNRSVLTNLVKISAENKEENIMFTRITDNVVVALCNELDMPLSLSKLTTGIILPFVMNMLKEKDGDESSFNLGGMFDMISGKKEESDSNDLKSGLSKGLGGLFG